MVKSSVAGLVLAVALLAAAPAAAQVAYLRFGQEPQDLHTRAVELFAEEAGAAVSPDDVIISPVDLSGDYALEMIAYARAAPFCDGRGCEPRIFIFDGETWRNILAPGVVRTATVPGAISIVNISQTGFSDILVGSVLLVFDGRHYVEEAPPEPTELDRGPFEAACSGSAAIVEKVAAEGAADGAPRFCACMADLFEAMGHEQVDMDDAAEHYAGTAPLDADDGLVDILTDYELSCRIELTTR